MNDDPASGPLAHSAGDETTPSTAEASSSADQTATRQIEKKRNEAALTIAVAGWLVPGLGHLLLRRRVRALVIFAAVAGLALTGYLLRGNVFPHRASDAFGTLGFLADAGSGIFYTLGRVIERGGPDVSRAAGDYGTRFIAAAGLVNVLAALDAYEISRRRRA